MWVKFYNTENDKTYECNLSVLPYLPFPKETYSLMNDILEYESVGKVQEAVYNYIYHDKQPSLTRKAEKAFFITLIEGVTRLSFKYFKKLSTLKNQGGSVRVFDGDKRDAITVEDDEKNDYFYPWVENGMTEEDYKSQLSESDLKAINAIR